uniref:Uncharacterized protein n=2 Tax=Meloidogyne incognita group TaxID=654580 RepID=A0A914M5D6_MELIC
LSVSLPQFANRYLPLEQQYLPRPFRMGLESDNFMRFQKQLRGGGEGSKLSYRVEKDNLEVENAGATRWRRRKELEDEAWNRLHAEGLTPPPPWSSNTSHPTSNRASPMPQLQIDTNIGKGVGISSKSTVSQTTPTNTKNTILSPISNKVTEKGEIVDNNLNTTKISLNSPSNNNSPKNALSPTTILDDSKTSPKQSQQKPQTQQIQKSGIPALTTNTTNKSGNSATNVSGSRGRLLMVTGPSRGGSNSNISDGTTMASGQGQNTSGGGRRISGGGTITTPIIQQQQQKKTSQKPPLPTTQRQISNEESSKGNKKASNNSRKNSLEKSEDEQQLNLKNNENKKQQKGGRIHCRSSSHGRPASSQTRRPSIEEGGQSIPVVEINTYSFLNLLAFFPTKSTGEWISEQQRCGLLLSRSRSNPQLFSNGIAPKFISLSQKAELLGNSQLRQSRFDNSGNRNLENINKINKSVNEEEDFYTRLRPRPKLILGGRGALGLLNWPRGLCAVPRELFEEEDDFGTILAVADSSNHRIQLFSSTDGLLIRSFGCFGKEDGQFDGCCSVCVHHKRKELFVADRYNHRVQVFDLKGRFLRKFGVRGSGPSQFQHCWGIAIDEHLGVVYVADKDNHRVQMFNEDGTFLSRFGSEGDGPKQLDHPLYLMFDPNQRLLYVSDSANNRLCIYSPDGLPVFQFQGSEDDAEQLKLPRGIALDKSGHLLVADSGNSRVQIYSKYSGGHKIIKKFGSWGPSPGQFKGVEGICCLQNDENNEEILLAIADRENNRVQLFG